MLSSMILMASTFALGTIAITPTLELDRRGPCLSRKEAKEVGNLWRELLGNYTQAAAHAGLTSEYHDYSASALSLNSVCVQAPGPSLNATEPLFTNRTIFELAQGRQNPIPSTLLDIWSDCHTVTMRYEMCITGNCTIPVIGMVAIQTVKAPAGNKYPFQINSTYSEFDSEAWIKNLKHADRCVSP